MRVEMDSIRGNGATGAALGDGIGKASGPVAVGTGCGVDGAELAGSAAAVVRGSGTSGGGARVTTGVGLGALASAVDGGLTLAWVAGLLAAAAVAGGVSACWIGSLIAAGTGSSGLELTVAWRMSATLRRSFGGVVSAPGSSVLATAGCGGVAVFPGDIMVADDDGAVVVPAALAAEVTAEAVKQEAFEEWVVKEVRQGAALPGLYPPNDATLARYRDHMTSENQS